MGVQHAEVLLGVVSHRLLFVGKTRCGLLHGPHPGVGWGPTLALFSPLSRGRESGACQRSLERRLACCRTRGHCPQTFKTLGNNTMGECRGPHRRSRISRPDQRGSFRARLRGSDQKPYADGGPESCGEVQPPPICGAAKREHLFGYDRLVSHAPRRGGSHPDGRPVRPDVQSPVGALSEWAAQHRCPAPTRNPPKRRGHALDPGPSRHRGLRSPPRRDRRIDRRLTALRGL